MKIDAYKDKKIAQSFKAFDLDINEYIEHVICANQETGEYEVYEVDEDTGRVEWDIVRERPKTIKKQGNLVLVYQGEVKNGKTN